MIRHTVFFTARDPDDRDTIFAGLDILRANPHALKLHVGRNLQTDDIPGPQVDFVVYGEFADAAQMAAFKAHPLYAESIRIVRPLRDLRVSADVLIKDEGD
ncbi:MAG: stress responsive protein [Thalassobium sp.]|uniref:Dabb family protein n=1 Tax=Octadecabacter sp. SW4 TaxID=2602067 RepID=UPI000C0E45CB|nr:Dabb family protein [Octadecabacter sp. SW4]PHQ85520.1 MAG: stress responsive protein [Thalassobium sp.]QEE35153.1 Dabb family protein [Octadecabacter sp. SW4]|tara:strand:+ start:446 stop:748 length:303 start_codon:yes stop_codon:yes gene_type:complete